MSVENCSAFETQFFEERNSIVIVLCFIFLRELLNGNLTHNMIRFFFQLSPESQIII